MCVVRAALGYPAPTTFLHAVSAGFITGPSQFSRLTTKMVRCNLPQAMTTARWHLDKAPASQPHEDSDAVSAQKRRHSFRKAPPLKPFIYEGITKSTVLHLDYTGDLPEICLSGTRCFMVSCWG